MLSRVLTVVLLLVAHGVQAQTPSYAGLLEKIGGTVAARSAGGTAFQPTAFSRLRAGDELELGAGAEVQLVYFENRMREQWQGPARFRVQASGSEWLAGNAAQANEIKGAPTRVALATAGNVQRIGGLTLRSVPTNIPDDASIAQAQADYAAWSAAADPTDILPELYMIGFLETRRDPALLAPYVEVLLKKRPDQPEVKALAKRLGFAPAP